MELVPVVAGVAVGGILIIPVVVAVALVLPALYGVHVQDLAEHPVHVQVQGGRDAAAIGRVGDGSAHVDEVDRLPRVIGPLDVLASARELDVGMASGLALRAVVLARGCRGQRHHAGAPAESAFRRLVGSERRRRPRHAGGRGVRRLVRGRRLRRCHHAGRRDRHGNRTPQKDCHGGAQKGCHGGAHGKPHPRATP